jgi:photosystem II stability/assembly factor-like uncharacterized protein
MYSLIARAPVIVVVGVAVLAAGACAGNAAAPVRPAAAASAAVSLNCRAITPVSASFVSGTTGWLLGLATPAGSRIVLCRTADGGRHWFYVPAPPAPWPFRSSVSGPAVSTGPDAVSQIVFANQRDGWAFGPGLWATHDGGAHWHRVGTSGASVSKMAATSGRVVAVFSRDGGTTFAAYTSPAGADAWRPLPGVSGAGQAVGGADLGVFGGTGYVVSSHAPLPGPPAVLLAGPADGSARWQRYALPCPSSMEVAVTAATRPGIIVACAGIGFHPTPARVYRSVDGGRSWHRLAGLVLEDSVGSASVAPDGTILVSGLYSGVLMSDDGGQSWHPVPAVDDSETVQGGGIVTAVMVTNQLGFAVVTGDAFWLTHDGGQTWTAVTVSHR